MGSEALGEPAMSGEDRTGAALCPCAAFGFEFEMMGRKFWANQAVDCGLARIFKQFFGGILGFMGLNF